MNIISDIFKGIIWFVLCIVMAIGMIFFAIAFLVLSFFFKNMSWKDVSFPSLKFAK